MQHGHLLQFVKLGRDKAGTWREEKLKCSNFYGRGFERWRQQWRLSSRMMMNWSVWSARDHSKHVTGAPTCLMDEPCSFTPPLYLTHNNTTYCHQHSITLCSSDWKCVKAKWWNQAWVCSVTLQRCHILKCIKRIPGWIVLLRDVMYEFRSTAVTTRARQPQS